MALKLSSRNLFRSADILQNQSQKNKKSVSNIGKTLQRQSVFKRQSISKRKNLYAQRATAIRRKNQQDFLDASRSTGSRRSVGQIVRGSNKGFFGRILEAVSFAMVGWAVQNLPRIVTMANKLGQQIPKLTVILSSFMNNTFSIFKEIGALSSGLVRSLLTFDINSMGKQVQTSLVNLSIQFGRLEDDLYEGMKIFAEVFKFEPEKPGPGQQPPSQQPPSAPGPGPTGKIYGVNLRALADATSEAEGTYSSVGPTTYLGHGLGRYQFMTGRGDVQSIILNNAGNEKSKAQSLINRSLGGDRSAARQLLKYFPPSSQDSLFSTHAQNTLTQIKRKYPNADESFLVQKFGVYHLTGGDYPNSRDINGTSGKAHGDKILGAYKKLRDKVPSGSPGPGQPRPASTNFTAVTGTSGSVRVSGREQAPLSVPYSPFKPGSRMVITSGIGYRSSTNSNHSGYDIAGPEGTPIYAYFPGKIVNVGVWNGSYSGYGNYVVWQDDIYGAYHFFGHMRDRPGWSPGQKFSQGTLIGYVGNTGRSTGPHLHWEISESRPDSIGNFSSLEDPGSWLRKHPLVFSSTSQRTPAQISSTKVTQNIPENITPSNEGETIYVTVPQQAYQNPGMSAGAGGGGSIIIGGGDSLNSLIKQRILLELAYT